MVISFLQSWTPPPPPPLFFFEGTPPPFWVPSLSEANLKNIPLFLRAIFLRAIHITIITLYNFRFNSVFTTDSLVRYCLYCFSYLTCNRNEHETSLITILLNLMCV